MSDEPKIVEPGDSAEATANSTATADPTADLQARLAQAEKEAADYKDQYLRAAADYKNFKRRADIERAELIRSAGADLILKLLPVVDDFDRAIASIPAEIASTPWWGGTQLIAHKLRLLLESQNVKPIEAVGQEFNPNLHEAVLYEDAPGQDGLVVEELQKGYKLGERVLRPSMVKVGRG